MVKIIKRVKSPFPEPGLCSKCGNQGDVRQYRIADDMEFFSVCEACDAKITEASMFIDPGDTEDDI